MIKRFTIALLTVVYLVVAVGVTISGHFCGGYLESYSFNVVSEEHDCCGGMPMDNNCCKNVQVTIKSSEDHYASDVVKVEPVTTFIAIPYFTQEFFTISTCDVAVSPVLHPPPLLSKCPVHIQNRVFLI